VLFGVLISVFGGLISGSDLEILRAQGSPPPQAFSGSEKWSLVGLTGAPGGGGPGGHTAVLLKQ
jgi:hypothetical protein